MIQKMKKQIHKRKKKHHRQPSTSSSSESNSESSSLSSSPHVKKKKKRSKQSEKSRLPQQSNLEFKHLQSELVGLEAQQLVYRTEERAGSIARIIHRIDMISQSAGGKRRKQ